MKGCSKKRTKEGLPPRKLTTKITINENFETDTDEEAINMAEYIRIKPNECQALKRPTITKEKRKISKANRIVKEYSFNLTKAD